jgi:hypothetical protein|tara:strand:+ start:559 stop:897 length:339 start_codon:yes stop_codon:yes gene_type:complete
MENFRNPKQITAARGRDFKRDLIPSSRTVRATLFGANVMRSSAKCPRPMHFCPLNFVRLNYILSDNRKSAADLGILTCNCLYKTIATLTENYKAFYKREKVGLISLELSQSQ